MKRKKYLVHPSSQLKYIAMSVLPALVMGTFCIYFLIKSGELIFRIEKEKLLIETFSFNQTIQQLERTDDSKQIIGKIKGLQHELQALQNILKITYFDALKEWQATKIQVFVTLIIFLMLIGWISLLYSHRIAGPFYRIIRCIDMLAEGKDVALIQFRNPDEFKEVAAHLEKLRQSLKKKGMLKD